ncbi:MAG: hypothetical protein VKO00_05745 [Cyanobacteriota bacterium]|nr:hypothetical protein [Cyanobacteriota bacterium]
MAKSPSASVKWIGTSGADTYVGTSGDDVLQGSAGNDTMTGGRGKDTFIFESNYAGNGTDTIVDFFVKTSSSPKGAAYDILDLSRAIGKQIAISGGNIGNYIWVAGDKLFVDPSGAKNSPNPWAILTGVKQGDQLRVRTGSFDGWITAGASLTKSVYLTVGRAGVWEENAATANGILDGSEALISGASLQDANSDGFYTISGIDVATDNVTVRFVDGRTATKLDLTGFGTGDKLILDGKTNQSDYYGFKSQITVNTLSPTVAFSGNKYVGLSNSNYISFNAGSYLSALIRTKSVTKVAGQLYASKFRGFGNTLRNSDTITMAMGLSNPAGYAFEAIKPII